jgi:hypothetical protein
MSEATKKGKKFKWTTAQAVGFWVLLAGLSLFWGGVAVGTQATLNSISEREAIEANAIEAYKAETSKENQ